jgi:hypothetical protein
LERKGYYIGRSDPKVYATSDFFIRRGLKKAIVDVAGVKNVGKTFFDDIEIAIIETKHSNTRRPITLQELEQTKGYQDYGHICYLATTENVEITKERETDAKNRGIGLLQIPLDFYKKRPNQIKIEDLTMIQSPTSKTPNEGEMLEFLDTLGILRCTLCGCYFHSWEEYEEKFPSLKPIGRSFKWLARNKVFELFPDKIDYGLYTTHKYRKSKIWKHLCLLCIEDLEKLYEIDKMKEDISALKKEVAKLKEKN